MPLATLPRLPGLEPLEPKPDADEVILRSRTTPRGKKEYWRQRAREAARRHGIDEERFVRQIEQESGYDEDVIYGRRVSSAGAKGIGQFMDPTAAEMGIDPLNPEEALDGAARYYKKQRDYLGGGDREALAAYNAGAGTVERLKRQYGERWEDYLPAETRKYLEIIEGGSYATALDPDAMGDTSGPEPQGPYIGRTPSFRDRQRSDYKYRDEPGEGGKGPDLGDIGGAVIGAVGRVNEATGIPGVTDVIRKKVRPAAADIIDIGFSTGVGSGLSAIPKTIGGPTIGKVAADLIPATGLEAATLAPGAVF